MLRALAGLILCLVFPLTGVASAQVFDATHMGQPADLEHAPWRFATGDDLHWADPGFDDSQWQPLAFDKSMSALGHPGYSGPWWYRLHVRVAPGAHHLALSIDSGSYQIYVNGVLVGQAGGFPNHPGFYQDVVRAVPIPDALLGGDSLVIAVREFVPAMMSKNDITSDRHLRLGDVDALQTVVRVNQDQPVFEQAGTFALALITLVIGLWALGLYRSQPDHREYLWLGLFSIAVLSYTGLNLVGTVLPVRVYVVFIPVLLCASLAAVAYVLFVVTMLRLPLTWPIRAYCVLCLLPPFLITAVLAGWLTNLTTNIIYILIDTPVDLFGPLLALRQYRRGDREAGVLLIPLLLKAGADYALFAGGLLELLHLRRPGPTSLIPDLQLGPVPLHPTDLSNLLFVLTIGFIMLQRSIRITREQQRVAAELDAARTVQALLLGHEAAVPGYRIQSAYIPAQEVGGDFFQTMPTREGELVVVIGDVAGKGLRAAMRVSMLVGALRLMRDTTPAQVLQALNDVLLGQGGEGFTTCLAARCGVNGTMTVANAGHLAPYLNGRELVLDGNLPLGVAAGVEYTEQSFRLAPGDRVLFLSDGVVEARNDRGELYGFARLSEAATRARDAADVAGFAQSFGQEDDITVLVLEREPVPALAAQ